MGKKIKVYNHSIFTKNINHLIKRKKNNNQNIILCFPCLESEDQRVLLNEIKVARKAQEKGLVDFICLAYAGKKDSNIAQAAEKLGVKVVFISKVDVPDMLSAKIQKGKGADMRRFAYYACQSLFTGSLDKNIVGYLDADIRSQAFGLHYIAGLFGPHIINPEKVKITKLVYRRRKGYGRVNELLGRPLFSVFKHPKLSILKSLPYIFSGEVGFRGDMLLDMRFCQRYGVEIYTLLQCVLDSKFGASCLELTNVSFMDHKHQPLSDLKSMAFLVLRIWLLALAEYKIIKWDTKKTGLSTALSYSEINMNNKVVYVNQEIFEQTYQPLRKIIE